GTRRECRRNLETLSELCPGIRLTNFCYPFGCVSLPRKLQLQKSFDTCRGIYEGINARFIDLALLKVIELYDRTLTPEKLSRTLRRAHETRGWVIFYVHDVTDNPTHMGCSPRLLRSTIKEVQAQGIQCLSIRQALPVIGYPSNAAMPDDGARRGALEHA